MPFAAMIGIRRNFFPTNPLRARRTMAMPVPPVAASAGTRIRKPHGIDAFTAITAASDPKSSTATVEIQKLAMVSKASAPAIGWTVFFILGTPGLLQMWLRDTVICMLK
jgi:hypothetical protein